MDPWRAVKRAVNKCKKVPTGGNSKSIPGESERDVMGPGCLRCPSWAIAGGAVVRIKLHFHHGSLDVLGA